MLRQHCFIIATMLSALAGASRVSASPILITFSGFIHDSTTPEIPNGTPYSGKLFYETPGTLLASNPPYGNAFFFGPSDLLALQVGSYSFSISTPVLNVIDQFEVTYHQPLGGGIVRDIFSAANSSGSGISSNLPGYNPDLLSFELAGPAGLLFSDGLPTAIDTNQIVPIGYAGAGTGFVVGFSGGRYVQSYSFASINIQAVPEPATAMLAGLGLLTVIFSRQKHAS